MRITGKQLSKEWGVDAAHALYRSVGNWYHNLAKFPGALFDSEGYIKFKTREEYEGCSSVSINYVTNSTHVEEPGIRAILGYVRVSA